MASLCIGVHACRFWLLPSHGLCWCAARWTWCGGSCQFMAYAVAMCASLSPTWASLCYYCLSVACAAMLVGGNHSSLYDAICMLVEFPWEPGGLVAACTLFLLTESCQHGRPKVVAGNKCMRGRLKVHMHLSLQASGWGPPSTRGVMQIKIFDLFGV
jgi:hypothetical protein